MLHLQAGVHLQEEVLAGRCIDEELHRAEVAIADGAGKANGIVIEPAPDRVGEVRGGRFLENLLVVALDGAVALEEMDHRAVMIGGDLHLDMARAAHQPFQQQPVVAKGGLGLAPRGGDGLGHVGRGLHHPHALAAATGRGLHQQRKADARGRRDQGRVVAGIGIEARHHRNAGGDREALRRDLRAHGGDHLSRRADEGDTSGGAGGGEVRRSDRKP